MVAEDIVHIPEEEAKKEQAISSQSEHPHLFHDLVTSRRVSLIQSGPKLVPHVVQTRAYHCHCHECVGSLVEHGVLGVQVVCLRFMFSSYIAWKTEFTVLTVMAQPIPAKKAATPTEKSRDLR